MQVIKDKKLQDIDWAFVEDDQDLPAGNIIVSFDRFNEEKQALISRSGSIGVILSSDTPVETIQEDLVNIDLIALKFDNYVDGRSFSQARWLRDRHQYSTDILAYGDILRDQVAHLARCGVNLIQLQAPRDAEDALQAFSEQSAPYQPGADQVTAIPALR